MILNTYKGEMNIPNEVYTRGICQYDVATDLCKLTLMKKDGTRVNKEWCKSIMENEAMHKDGVSLNDSYSISVLKKYIINLL